MNTTNSKFFNTTTAKTLKSKADDFAKYENLMLDSLTKSSELAMELKAGKTISDIARAVWIDLFADKPYQITVFDTDTIKGISKELFTEYFEAVTANKCRCLTTIPNIKKSEKYDSLKEALTGLKSGAYKDPVFQCITRCITTIANKQGGNKPTSSILEVLGQALATASKIGARENIKDNQDILELIRSELKAFEKALVSGEEFTNPHKKEK